MSKTILFIDGENLRHYIKNVLKKGNITKQKNDINNIDLKGLFDCVLKRVSVDERIFYSAKLHLHQDTLRESKRIIQRQRTLKSYLENNGFIFLISGNVRPHEVFINRKKKIIFREKGVDVKLAVDLVTMSCDKKIKTAVLCSSDSDLQPAIREAKSRGVEIIYLGFEINPNKGLIYTSDRTILIRNSEVLDFLKPD